ncbi:MAG: hypothetical protein L0287_28170 [Anaerolineae bacterium]|nr:hypothetical protein [Anaerolineae bacterium]MCI0607643.1 hypothetical protein [Anaerolineae bacterium]
MVANKSIFLTFLFWGLVATSCASEVTPTAQFGPTVTPIEQESTSTVFIGIPPISNPLVQAEGESMEEFVARIAARNISYNRPVLIALSHLKEKSTVLFGVPSGRQDVQQCWFYETDSNRACTSEDLEKYFSDLTIPKIFFAFAYSTSGKSLYLIEHFYDGDEYYFTDYYRLILELKDAKWVEKLILPVYW